MSIHPVAVFPVDKANRPRVAVLLNTNARSVGPRVVKAIEQVVPPRDLYVSSTLEEARQIVAEVMDKGYDTVLTGGGDGTFVGFLKTMREHTGGAYATEGNVVRALAPRPLPRLGVLRLGTGNALANLSGAATMSGGGVLEDILHVRAGRVSRCRRQDLVESEGIEAPFAGFGYDSIILNNYVRFKNLTKSSPAAVLGEGLSGYLLSLMLMTVPECVIKSFPEVEVRNAGAPAIRIGENGRQVGPSIPTGDLLFKGNARFVGAGTCPYFGFNFKIFPFATEMPGRMQLRVASTGVAQALSNLPAIWQGKWHSDTFHDYFVERVHVRFASPMPFQIGGDAQGRRDEVTMSVSDRPVDMLDFNRRR